MLSPGISLQGRYKIIRELGRGGMGAVYEAYDSRLGRTVALKETLTAPGYLRAAFEREAKILANLRHDSLPRILDHFSEAGGQFLVMEHIPGPDLSHIAVSAPVPLEQVLKWANDLLRVLEYLHAHEPSVVHRDIKPSNLKVLPSGRLVLLDFGLAKAASAFAASPSSTTTSVIAYSPYYAPPEQIQGDRTGPKSDIYAAAATLYHLITGARPADSMRRTSALLAEEADPMPPARAINPQVPAYVSDALARALSLKPHQRPSGARELRRMLNRWEAAELRDERIAAIESLRQAEEADEETVVYPRKEFQEGAARPDDFAPVRSRVSRWVTPVALVICLVVVSTGLYINNMGHGVKDVSAEASSSPGGVPPRTPLPSPYREVMHSVAKLNLIDASSGKLSTGDGLFVMADTVATVLGTIKGASGGTVTASGVTYEVTGVIADRTRGVALLKVAGPGPPAKPAAIADAKGQTDGAGVAVLSPEGGGLVRNGTVTGSRDQGNTLEISLADGDAEEGAPVVNSGGQVVAIISGRPDGGRVLAVPIGFISGMVKSKQPPMSLMAAGASELLHDFRRESGPGRNESEFDKVPRDEARRVLSSMFGSYLTDSSQCSQDEIYSSVEGDPLKAARAAAQVVPEVRSKANGSFTAAGTQQTAYLVFVGECGASHAESWGTRRLAVFEGGRIVANLVDVKDHDVIVGVYDVDGDGVNELLVEGGWMGQGDYGGWSSLVELKGRRFRVVGKFGAVDDNCGALGNKGTVEAAVIYYSRGAPGRPPEFRTDSYKARCSDDLNAPNPAAFRYVASTTSTSYKPSM